MRQKIRGIVLAAGLLAGLSGAAGAQILFSLGGPATDAARDIARDANGYIYITGTFQGTVDFDPGPGVAARTAQGDPADPVTGASAVDIYLAKYDPAGRFVWVAAFSSPGFDAAYRLRLDPAGRSRPGRCFLRIHGYRPVGRGLRSRLRIGSQRFPGQVQPRRQPGLGASASAIAERPPVSIEDPRGEDIFDFDFGTAGAIVATGGFGGTVDFDSDRRPRRPRHGDRQIRIARRVSRLLTTARAGSSGGRGSAGPKATKAGPWPAPAAERRPRRASSRTRSKSRAGRGAASASLPGAEPISSSPGSTPPASRCGWKRSAAPATTGSAPAGSRAAPRADSSSRAISP